jgi:hypothetical protein
MGVQDRVAIRLVVVIVSVLASRVLTLVVTHSGGGSRASADSVSAPLLALQPMACTAMPCTLVTGQQKRRHGRESRSHFR